MSPASITPPASWASVPIVALATTPATSAATMVMNPRTLPSGPPAGRKRRSSHTAPTISTRLPAVWASAVPTGIAP